MKNEIEKRLDEDLKDMKLPPIYLLDNGMLDTVIKAWQKGYKACLDILDENR